MTTPDTINRVSEMFGGKEFAEAHAKAAAAAAASGRTFHKSKKMEETSTMRNEDREVTTIWGSSDMMYRTAGSVDGIGISASLNCPRGLAVDNVGNLLVADEGGNCIRMMAPSGELSTIAGGGARYDDGKEDERNYIRAVVQRASRASFSCPSGVAVDSAGNVYVADQWNHCIRKINVKGMVTTLAGSPCNGHIDGFDAAFNLPVDVAVDSAGYVYVADQENRRVRALRGRTRGL